MKKFLTYGVVIATIIWSLGIGAIVPMAASAAYSPAAGDIVKVAGTSAVYYINSSLQRQLFSNRVTYGTWFSNFDGLKTITAAELSSINSGANVTVRPGTSLVKLDNGGAVYAVTPGAVLMPLMSGDAAKALYGADWGKKVVIVQVAFESNYTKGAGLTTTSKLPDGSVIKYAGSDSVYYISGGVKRLVTADAFVANKLSDSFVITNVPTSMTYADGVSVTGKEDAIAGMAASAAPVATGNVTVSLASDTPVSQNIAKNGQGVIYTRIKATAGSSDAEITGFTVDRTGLGSYTDFSKIYVQVDGIIKGTKRTLTSDNTVDIYLSTDANKIVIKAGQTVYIDIVADMLSVASGNQNALRISKVISSGTVGGSLPIVGNLMAISNIDAPTVTFAHNITGTSNVNIGDKQVTVGEYTIANSSSVEGVKVSKVTLREKGSASNSEVVNYTLYDQDAKVLATANADGSGYVVFNPSTPISIDKSEDTTITVKADVIGGKDETSQLLLDDESYLIAYGLSNNFRTVVTKSGTQVIYTINGGDLNISEATDNPVAKSVAPKATNVVLLKAKISAEKEPLTIQSLTVDLATGSGTAVASALKNVRLMLDGKVVAGPQDAAASEIFTEDFDVTGIQYLTVVADVEDSVAGTYSASINASNITAVDSKNDGVVETGLANGRTVTVTTGSVDLVKSTAYGNENVVTGKEVKLGSYLIRGGDTQDITINKYSLGLNYVKSASSSFALSNVSGLRIVSDGISTSYNGTISTSSVNDINVSIALAKNQTRAIDVFATIASITNASTTSFDHVSTTLKATYRAGSATASTSVSGIAGQTVALRTGALTVANDANMPDAGIAVGGTQGKEVAKYKFTADYDDYTITEMTINMSTSSLVTGLTVGGKTESSFVNGEAKFTGLSIAVAKDHSVTVPVTANFNTVGTAVASGASTTFALTSYKANSATNNVDESGLGTTYQSNAQYLRKTIPTVVVTAGSSIGSNLLVSSDNEMLTMKVSADKAADVILQGITLEITGTMTQASTSEIALLDSNRTVVTSTTSFSFDGNNVVWALTGEEQTIGLNSSKTYYIVLTETGSVTGKSLTAKLLNISWSDDNEADGITGSYVTGVPSSRYTSNASN